MRRSSPPTSASSAWRPRRPITNPAATEVFFRAEMTRTLAAIAIAPLAVVPVLVVLFGPWAIAHGGTRSLTGISCPAIVVAYPMVVLFGLPMHLALVRQRCTRAARLRADRRAARRGSGGRLRAGRGRVRSEVRDRGDGTARFVQERGMGRDRRGGVRTLQRRGRDRVSRDRSAFARLGEAGLRLFHQDRAERVLVDRQVGRRRPGKLFSFSKYAITSAYSSFFKLPGLSSGIESLITSNISHSGLPAKLV